MEQVIEIIKKRILLAEENKRLKDTGEMEAFWDGQLRCAQALLNEVAHVDDAFDKKGSIELIIQLSRMDPTYENYRGDEYCFFCGREKLIEPFHEDDCIWLVSKRKADGNSNPS
jgi:hypothetical protein